MIDTKKQFSEFEANQSYPIIDIRIRTIIVMHSDC